MHLQFNEKSERTMKRLLFVLAAVAVVCMAKAEDGSRLWLRYAEVNKATVKGPECVAAEELRKYYTGSEAQLVIDPTVADDEGYVISGSTVRAKTEQGLMYGAYALLRGETGASQNNGQQRPQRPEMTEEQRAQMQKMMEKRQEYNKKLKEILTDEQYKTYEEQHQRRGGRGGFGGPRGPRGPRPEGQQ